MPTMTVIHRFLLKITSQPLKLVQNNIIFYQCLQKTVPLIFFLLQLVIHLSITFFLLLNSTIVSSLLALILRSEGR